MHQILVVDDDLCRRDDLCQALLFRGYRVIVACDGEQALTMESKYPSHGAVVQLHAFDLADQLTIAGLSHQSPHLRLLAVGAGTGGSQRFNARRAGATDTLAGPPESDRIVNAVATMFEQRYNAPPAIRTLRPTRWTERVESSA